jgi:hypothetical protein
MQFVQNVQGVNPVSFGPEVAPSSGRGDRIKATSTGLITER